MSKEACTASLNSEIAQIEIARPHSKIVLQDCIPNDTELAQLVCTARFRRSFVQLDRKGRLYSSIAQVVCDVHWQLTLALSRLGQCPTMDRMIASRDAMTKQSDSGSSTATRLLEGPAQLSVDSALSLGLPTACARPVLTIRWLMRSGTGLLAQFLVKIFQNSRCPVCLSHLFSNAVLSVFLCVSLSAFYTHSLILSLLAPCISFPCSKSPPVSLI